MLLGELDLGEAETIVLAREIGADWVLMDEKKGRRKLAQLDTAQDRHARDLAQGQASRAIVHHPA